MFSIRDRGILKDLIRFSKNGSRSELLMKSIYFLWCIGFRFMGYLLEIFDEDNARLIGSKLGEILEMDDIEAHSSFLRIKIRFLATTPLQPGFPYYRADGDSVWIGFKYEWLSSFCVHYGFIDHIIEACFQNQSHPQ